MVIQRNVFEYYNMLRSASESDLFACQNPVFSRYTQENMSLKAQLAAKSYIIVF